jgi:adenine-specific DNA-methyltransferase
MAHNPSIDSELQDIIKYVEVVKTHVDELYTRIVNYQTRVLPLLPQSPASSRSVSPHPLPSGAPFRPISNTFNTSLSKTERHDNGIYFTPQAVRQRLFEVLAAHGVTNPATVLEPSAGSGEFVYDAAERWPTARIFAVEKHPKLFGSLKATPNILTYNADFLTFKIGQDERVDVVIGNPPYFVTKQKQPACMTGRGNIYVQFIYKCLTEHMKPDAVLAFVLPTSFYNCAYYEPCRKYMAAHTTVLHLENLDADFYDTAQDTMLMVVRASAPATARAAERPYFFEFSGGTYLSPHYKELSALISSASTVSSLGLSVKTGEVVWNEHKDKLHATEGTLVIYSSNIVKNTLVLDNLGGEKKQRIRGFTKEPVAGPALLIGRGYGNKFTLAYVKIAAGTPFYGENHVNVVTGPEAALDRLARSLSDSRTTDFLRMFVGNGALSKSEISDLLPVFA